MKRIQISYQKCFSLVYLSLIVEISSGNLRISACRTAERSERMSFVSLARSASVPPFFCGEKVKRIDNL